ncbi:MAG TPA: LLM class flavin-dependent oxidoreductase [Acidimicrobiales bacterium]
MRLGLNVMRPSIRFGQWGSDLSETAKIVSLAEDLGYHSVWTAEASGTDATSPLAWLAAQTTKIQLGTAIMQIAGRSPGTTAMTAATLDLLSGRRFLLGLGVSGAAVVEAWHNQPYGRPLAKTREYVTIVKQILARRAPIDFHGEYYDIPYYGPGSTHLADPIKLMFRPPRTSVPIYIAAMGPKNVSLAFEVADGIIPAFYSPYNEDKFFGDIPKEKRKSLDIAPFVYVCVGDDIGACRDRLRPGFAFWFGVMGSRRVNYYNEFAQRLGYEEAAAKIAKLYLEGRPGEAALAVPDELIDEVALCGPPARIRDQLAVWSESSVGTMICSGVDRDTIVLLAELAL